MPPVRLTVPSPVGGVSRQPTTQRLETHLEEADNVTLYASRGLEKRPGSTLIESPDTADGSLDAAEPTSDFAIWWIHRDGDEHYAVVLNPDAVNDADLIEVFNAQTGAKATVSGMTADIAAYLREDPGTQTPPARFRSITNVDTTFILNRRANSAFGGSAVDYINPGDVVSVRNSTNARHFTDWGDFPKPPPAGEDTGSVGPNNDGYVYYAADAALGQPAGFYEVIAAGSTQAPWYKRIRTEQANSEIDQTTMPVKLFNTGDGTFDLDFFDWDPRYSGDSLLNPGPQVLTGHLHDIALHMDRLWLARS